MGLPAGKAVRITFRNKVSGFERELIYAQVDLLTPSRALDGLLAGMHSQAPLFTMMKATGYIIRRHKDNALNERSSDVRLDAAPLERVILSDSEGILQDDSGVRLSCLGGWHISFWGDYFGPAELIETKVNVCTDYDDSLHALWCQSKSKQPLPVRFGYPLFWNAHNVSGCPSTYNHACDGRSAQSKLGAIIHSIGFATYATKMKGQPMRKLR